MNVSKVLGYLMVALMASCMAWTSDDARGAEDDGKLDRLEQIIQQQQAQIESQARAIEQLKRQVDQLAGQVRGGPEMGKAPVEETASATGPGEEVGREQIVEEATSSTRVEAEPLNEQTGVRTGSDKVSVQLYGQVNKAVLYTDDGNEDNWYVVDNSNSSTRIGLLGAVAPSADLEAGTRIEVQFQTNPSTGVSQRDKNDVGTNNFTKRWFDVYLLSDRFGELRLGHGSTASDGTSEVDLSGTAVIGYSSVTDMAGGHFFYDSAADALTTTRVSDVLTNMDGLGRDDRIFYETPEFYGFKGSTSWVSGGGADASIAYAAKWGPIAWGAAAAYASYGSESVGLDNQVNGSASVLHDSGFNFTLAAGRQSFHLAGRDDATFYYGKFGYRHDFFRFGETALAVDTGRTYDLDINGDEADSVGLVGVQNFEQWGTEYYFGYRRYHLDRPGTDLNSIDALMTGVRVKF